MVLLTPFSSGFQEEMFESPPCTALASLISCRPAFILRHAEPRAGECAPRGSPPVPLPHSVAEEAADLVAVGEGDAALARDAAVPVPPAVPLKFREAAARLPREAAVRVGRAGGLRGDGVALDGAAAVGERVRRGGGGGEGADVVEPARDGRGGLFVAELDASICRHERGTGN